MRKDEISRIKRATDIVQLGRELGIQIGDNGRARCLFPELHKNGDAHPSLEFDRDRGRAKCRACGKIDVDVVGLVRLVKKSFTFPQSLAFLSKRAGLPMPSSASWISGDRRAETLAQAHRLSLFAGEAKARMGGAGLRYLVEERGLAEAIVRQQHLGFVRDVDEICEAIRQRGDKSFSLDAAGLRSLRVYARQGLSFVVFPYLADVEGDDRQTRRMAVFLKARAIDVPRGLDVPKYVANSGEAPVLFNGLALDDLNEVFLAEGEIDALSLLSHDLPAVGCPGASAFKDAWGELFIDKRVIIAFDGDLAGQRGALAVAKKLRPFAKSIKRIELPFGEDINSFFARGRKCHAA